ncbi:MAG: penicillin-binding protein 2 [Rickettsiaceae bacterium]|nr:penicillin-binding protein 2 [Rickettsiaceae bacterium]
MLNKESLHNQLITRRAFVLGASGTGMLSLLAMRMFYMQAIKSDDYRILSDQNRISPIMIHPLRGNIFDCKNRLIAGNRRSFCLILDKNENKNYKTSLDFLFEILSLTESQKNLIHKKIAKQGLKTPLNIMDDISWEQLTIVEENIAKLPGIYVEIKEVREYKYDETLAHIVGYTGILNEKEKRELGINNVGNFLLGKNGLEKYYESTLRGNFGVKKMEVNASGSYVRELSTKESEQGSNLLINIDAQLQESIYKMLPSTGASAIVMDINNGKILSAASSPSFNPNNFCGGISQDYWKKLNDSPYNPLLNRISQGTYPPGSVFKLITVLAALIEGIDPSMIVNCTGGASALGNNHYRCWHTAGHGKLDMKAAIEHSCNSYMYKIVKMIGGERILSLARKLGFGTATGIDLPSESSGFVPHEEWKKRRYKTEWTLGDSLNISIGQGALLVTTAQLARLATIIASKGKLCTPKIVGTSKIVDLGIDERHFEFLQSAMYDVVNREGGTAYSKRVLDPAWLMAGKTGTSQVQAKRGQTDLNNVSFAGRNHALFLGFAPANKPLYSVVVVVDHGGGGGSAAAPIARDIVIELSKI